MNKSELVDALAEAADLPVRKSEEIVKTVFDRMFEALAQGDRIEMRGFGSFEIREYGGYLGRNPKTGEQIEVLGKRLPFFKVGKDLKRRINGASKNLT